VKLNLFPNDQVIQSIFLNKLPHEPQNHEIRQP
jgi:hypothetical protein